MTDATDRIADLETRLAEREAELGRLRQELAGERGRLDRELDFARRVQLNLMPSDPPQMDGWEVATTYRAAKVVGGDFYDVYPLPGAAGALGLVIADVTGKGLTAALMMAFSRAVLRSAAYNGTGPADALTRTNRVLVTDARTGLFLTAIAARLDGPTGVLRYASAGHEPPLVVRRGSTRARELKAGGQLLGAFESIDVVDRSIVLEPGDLFLAWTDGVTDARNARGARFGDRGLRDALRGLTGASAGVVVTGLAEAVARFAGDEPQADDLTLLAIRRSIPAG